MNKKLIITISILALMIVAFVIISSFIKLNPPIFITGQVATESGMVLDNIKSIKSSDEGFYLKVKKKGGILSGSEIKIIYHTTGEKCANPIQDAFSIKQGDKVEVHGVAVADDTISTCSSTDYYIKILGSVDSPQPQGAKISTEQECKSFRGQWRWGNYEKYTCILPAYDVEKECRNNSECQAACVAELTPQEEKLLSEGPGKYSFEKVGHCSEFVFGCYARVNNGKVDGILCAD